MERKAQLPYEYRQETTIDDLPNDVFSQLKVGFKPWQLYVLEQRRALLEQQEVRQLSHEDWCRIVEEARELYLKTD